MICSQCQAMNEHDSLFCANCGTSLTRSVPEQDGPASLSQSTILADYGQIAPSAPGGYHDPGTAGDQYAPGARPGQYAPSAPGSHYSPGAPPGQYGPGAPPGQYDPGAPANQYPLSAPPGQNGSGMPTNSYPPGPPPGQYGPGAPANHFPPSAPPGQYGPGMPTSNYPPGPPPGAYGPGTPTGQYPPGPQGHHYAPGAHAPARAFSLDLRRLSPVDQTVGGASLVVLISLFLPWFGIWGVSISGTTAHGYLVIVAILAVVLVAYLVLRAGWDEFPVNLPIAHAPLLLIGTGLQFLLVIIGFFDAPSGLSWEIGAYLALIASATAAGPVIVPAIRSWQASS